MTFHFILVECKVKTAVAAAKTFLTTLLQDGIERADHALRGQSILCKIPFFYYSSKLVVPYID
jgi:hypothetical protein